MRLFLSVLLSLFFVSGTVLGQESTHKLIETYDIRSYHPENTGLRDLAFEVHVPELTEYLNKEQIFGKLKKVYFKVYWVFQGGSYIEVVGMPNGFYERKMELQRMISPRLSYIIPEYLAKMVRGYSITERGGASGEMNLYGEDRANMSYINRINLLFQKDGQLNRMVMSSPAGERSTEFVTKVTSWSNSKWVIHGVKSKSIEGAQTVTMETTIKYKAYDGFGFPELIDVVTKQSLNIPVKEKGAPTEREIKSSVSFKNFEVNKGSASKKFADLAKEAEKSRTEEIKSKLNEGK